MRKGVGTFNASKCLHSLAHGECKDVAETPYVEIGEILVEVEVDPSESAGFGLDDDMVVADIAVAGFLLMQKINGLDTAGQFSQYSGQVLFEIITMIFLISKRY